MLIGGWQWLWRGGESGNAISSPHICSSRCTSDPCGSLICSLPLRTRACPHPVGWVGRRRDIWIVGAGEDWSVWMGQGAC